MNRTQRLLLEEDIKSKALDLQEDETVQLSCPFCEAPHEQSFSLTRTEQGLLYNCFRASCGAKGFVSNGIGTMFHRVKQQKVFKVHEFSGVLEDLPQYVLSDFFDKYELTEEELYVQGIKFSRAENRIFMPVFDNNAERFGGVSKSLTSNIKNFKTINYFVRQSSRLSYPRTGRRGTGAICVVEDILSAIKVTRHCRAVALLGHTISEEQIKEIRSKTDHLILMLDADVIQKALTLKKKYGFYFKKFTVVYMEKDPKDTPDMELRRLLE